VGLRREVCRLDLGEVAELADEDDAKGGQYLAQPRRGVLGRRLVLALLLGLASETNSK